MYNYQLKACKRSCRRKNVYPFIFIGSEKYLLFIAIFLNTSASRAILPYLILPKIYTLISQVINVAVRMIDELQP